jgi:hypothetical protein
MPQFVNPLDQIDMLRIRLFSEPTESGIEQPPNRPGDGATNRHLAES